MKQLLLIAALALLTVPAEAQIRDRIRDLLRPGQKHCDCVETERRLRGLHTAVNRAPMREYERRDVQRDARQGERIHDRVTYSTPYNEQSRICSLANQAVDGSWRRWQPWLARNGYDRPTYCENDNNRPRRRY